MPSGIHHEELQDGALLLRPRLVVGLHRIQDSLAEVSALAFKDVHCEPLGFEKPADSTSFGKVYQYDFGATKICGPMKELVEANGWKFEQIILGYQPSE